MPHFRGLLTCDSTYVVHVPGSSQSVVLAACPPILGSPSWLVDEDEATHLALPHLGWGGRGVVLCGCASPNSNVGAPTAGTPWAVFIHGLTNVHIIALIYSMT